MMASKRFGFPPGAFFTPTDRQVIDFYLKPKVLGLDLVFDVVENKQVYGPDSNPWQVFDLDDDESWFECADKETERVRLVFTKLSKIAKKNKIGRSRENTSKKAGCGTWVAKSKPEQIIDSHGNVVGERRYLVFDIKDNAAAVSGSRFGSFRMHEYCLSGINERFDPSRTHVLCKIIHDSSKKMVCPEIADIETNSTSTLIEPSVVVDDSVVVQDINMFGADFCFDDQGGEFSFCDDLCLDEDWISEIMNSITDEDLVQDTTKLGKRKFEEESFCGTKKLCMG